MYNNDYEVGKVIVALNKNVPPINSAAEVAAILQGINYEKVDVIFRGEKFKNNNELGDIILVYLKSKDKLAVIDAIEKLSANPNVAYAEPDYIEEMHVIPNDPLYPKLWGTQRIDAPLAWEYSTGSPGISVGVIDSGVDYNHPDIRKNMWSSPNRKYVNGWNFENNDGNPMDTNGHGTHVAGTIGAVGNNRIGITGICWQVKVVALKFGLDVASAIAAIYFANQFNIPILNASWGGPAYSRALKYAIDNYDGLFIASAGNSAMNNDITPIYPASYDSDNIISVAAINQNNNLAQFSNYGEKNVDIAAPGTEILSLGIHNDYTYQNGTSMSAPHVAGAAALLKSYMPNISTLDLKNIILSSAIKNPNLAGMVSTGGTLNVNAMFKLAGYWFQTK